MKKIEALEWLKSNNNPSAFATNRFGETINAINFVEKLYELGAGKVCVVGISDEKDRIEDEGGPYADSLLVELPEDDLKRNDIIKFYKKEMEEQGIVEGEGILEWNESNLDNGILGFGWY
ncbi:MULTISPECIES: hypothetical protein [Bacillaceae]|uniref:Uncharacterized protein n=1 Tax=Gottfriedia luciferensis TaxID=178774 RepID=A0ABX2ZJE4_9BACI|nr:MULTISPECIES: hypothetical protein [Bacillaceae]ODG89803.1 hypothetical protein BED47_15455 [Gottfriedia luciferensis]PGZ91422.1 hypothetical protein COE53_14530 [Bacillus sp. AFS029533]SFC74404.1 hypothetical protein SAMN02799633_01538 [Bacillus sp. UNCCL81]